MSNIIYTIFIFPIEQIIELCYVFVYRILNNPGLSIIGVSFAVSIFTLPLYFMAEKYQAAERNIQNKMKFMVDNIKAISSGDKRFMLLSAYYRQNNYHPLYSLRTSISLVILIPFFIAAYHFLSHLEIIRWFSLGPISDLGKPDSLLVIGNNSINILPFIMTLINCASTYIYTKGLETREKIQLYGIAVIFLILLYNSPSGLVLYWTCNNLFSLSKNIIQKSKYSKNIIYIITIILLTPVCIYVLFFHDGVLSKRLILFFTVLFVLLIPLIKRYIHLHPLQKAFSSINVKKSTFFLSLAGMFLLLGLVIPSSLIVSSVADFSYLDPYVSPLPYIGFTLLQCFGFSLLAILIYMLFDKNIKYILTLTITFFLIIFFINSLTFPKEYGIMTSDLHFEIFPEDITFKSKILNLLIILLTSFIVFIIIKFNKKILLFSIQIILIISFSSLGIYNLINISKDLKINHNAKPSAVNVFSLSKTGKNVIVILLDKAVSGYFPYALEEKPELKDSYNGFVFYPNTVAAGRYTIHGLPGVFGGYYYSAYEIHKRQNELQKEKIQEAVQVLPRIFASNDFNVNAENLPYIENSIFDNISNITVTNNNDLFRNDFLKDFNIKILEQFKILYHNFIRFSIFKTSPVFLHKIFYDHGEYLSINNSEYFFSKNTIDNYSYLFNLSMITDIKNDNSNHALILYNALPHSPTFLELPDYTPSNNIINKKEGLFSDESNYYVNMASFLLLAKWFDFLKENDAYNNTRIIIVSDHGNGLIEPLPNDIHLPHDRWLRYYNALLLVKDFNSKEELKTDYTFMTNADVPHIAAEGLINNLNNPFNGDELYIDKNNGYIITSSKNYSYNYMDKYKYVLNDNEWLHVHTNIFDPANWSEFKPEGK